MSGDLRCTQPERWTAIPGFEAPDKEILQYLEHVEDCPFHSMLENNEIQVVKQDFQTARSATLNGELPLSDCDKDQLLDEFQRYLDLRQSSQQVDHSSMQIAAPSGKISKHRRSWFPTVKRPAFVLSVAAIGAVIIIGLWQLTYRSPAIAPPPDYSSTEPQGSASINRNLNASPPSAIVLNDAGSTIQLDDQGALYGLPFDLSSTNAEAVRKALKDQVISVAPLPKALLTETEARMGSEDTPTFTLVRPTQNIVLTPTPTFVWNKLPGAKTYTVNVYDEQDNLVLSSKPMEVTTWKPDTRLPRGKVYSWEVTALKEGQQITSNVSAADLDGKTLEAKFKVLEQSKADEITAAKKRYRDFHLLLGIIEARAGLLDEAEMEFKQVLNSNPQSNIAQNLLRRIQVTRASTRKNATRSHPR
jgi:hypothetical protein